ncbi:MAG: LDCC motif putative metal-binding protein [Thermotaleaceae bacterium]
MILKEEANINSFGSKKLDCCDINNKSRHENILKEKMKE